MNENKDVNEDKEINMDSNIYNNVDENINNDVDNNMNNNVNSNLADIINAIKGDIEDCDMLLIGVGEELSAFTNKTVKDSEFYKKYISYINQENMEKFELLSKYVMAKQSSNVDLYNRLSEYIKKKNYFIISTNTDGCLLQSKLNKKRIVTPCGNITQLQCDCEDENHIYSGIDEYEKCYTTILSSSVNEANEALEVCFSKCIDCDRVKYANIHKAENYNENGYIKSWELYNKWLTATLNKKLVIIELGEGFTMPGVIRWPFEKVTFVNNKAKLYRVNEVLPQLPDNLADKGCSLKVNSRTFLTNLIL